MCTKLNHTSISSFHQNYHHYHRHNHQYLHFHTRVLCLQKDYCISSSHIEQIHCQSFHFQVLLIDHGIFCSQHHHLQRSPHQDNHSMDCFQLRFQTILICDQINVKQI